MKLKGLPPCPRPLPLVQDPATLLAGMTISTHVFPRLEGWNEQGVWQMDTKSIRITPLKF